MERLRKQLEEKTVREHDLRKQLKSYSKQNSNLDDNIRHRITQLDDEVTSLQQSLQNKNLDIESLRSQLVSFCVLFV